MAHLPHNKLQSISPSISGRGSDLRVVGAVQDQEVARVEIVRQ